MPLIETPDSLDDARHPLLWPVAYDRIAHLPTPTPDDDDDEDDNKDRGSGGGNIDPDDDEGGSDDVEDDEDDTLWAGRPRAAPGFLRG